MNAPFSPGSGFTDPVLGPQALFRVLLDAMSRPGLVYPVPETGVHGPDVVPREALALLLALCDHDTPVWFDEGLRNTAVARWLAFHSSAPMTSDPARASFGILQQDLAAPRLSDFALGDPRYPDRSTTLVVLCESFEGGEPLTLEGPGIETSVRLAPRSLPAGFIEQAQDNHALYPCGLDFLLLAGGDLVGLPRSTRIIREAR